MEIDGYVFSRVEPEMKEKIYKLYEANWFFGTYDGYCGFRSIEAGKEYEDIHYFTSSDGANGIPQKGELMKGYLYVHDPVIETTSDKNVVKYLKFGPRCFVEGCLEVLDVDTINEVILCQIPNEDEYIIVFYEDGVDIDGTDIKCGECITFSGAPCIGNCIDYRCKAFDGEKTIWLMVDEA